MQNRQAGGRQPTGDLRVRRTRKILHEAVIALSQEKGFEQVTVAEITKRAMVNRATFYRHYQDKYDLVKSSVKELLEALPVPQIEEQHGSLRAMQIMITPFFAAIFEHAAFYRAVSGKQGWPHLLEYIGGSFDRLMHQSLRGWLQSADQATIPLDLCITVVNATGCVTLKWWLEHDLASSPEQMSRWFLQLVKPSLCQLLNMQAEEGESDNSGMFPQ